MKPGAFAASLNWRLNHARSSLERVNRCGRELVYGDSILRESFRFPLLLSIVVVPELLLLLPLPLLMVMSTLTLTLMFTG